MRDQMFLLTDSDLAAVAAVALGNPIRTVAQQDALLRVCESLDNDLVQWSHDALVSWEGRRCVCGRAIALLVDSCSDCIREAVAS